MKVELTHKSYPLVTVIVPTYNYAHFISQTLESVCVQTYQNWECIVVDDGSTDHTNEVVSSRADEDGRIKYVYQENQGQAAARNKGIRLSAGKYFQFLDADDLIENRKIELQVDYLERHREVDIVYGGVRYFTTENPEARLHSMWGDNISWMPKISGKGKNVLSVLVRENIMVINSPLVRRSTIDDVGLFDESLPPLEDWDYWIRCAAAEKLFHFEDSEGTLALVRSHPLSSHRNNHRALMASIGLQRKIAESTTDQDLLARVRETERWLLWRQQLGVSARELAARIRPQETFILVDENPSEIRDHLAERNVLPFLERDGQYWGPPSDDETAIDELARLRKAGAEFMVFAWPAFWWLDHYSGLRDHLRSEFRCVLENDRLVVFDLRS
jgi:glycosyltransferase involved in cell wall biosynthesis